MQHGTGREAVRDIVESVEAVLVREGRPFGDLVTMLKLAGNILNKDEDLDQPGVYGMDYPS